MNQENAFYKKMVEMFNLDTTIDNAEKVANTSTNYIPDEKTRDFVASMNTAMFGFARAQNAAVREYGEKVRVAFETK